MDTVNDSDKMYRIFGTPRMALRLPNMNVLFLATLSGSVNASALEAAVRTASNKHLLLNAVIAFDQNQVAYYRIRTDLSPEIHVLLGSLEVQTVIQSELQKPFDLEKGPLIRFTLLDRGGDTQLLICCHHAICDGLSLIYLATDLARLLRNDESVVEQVGKLTLLKEESLPDKLKNNPVVGMMVKRINRAWAGRDIPFTADTMSEIQTLFWQKHVPGLILVSLSDTQTKDLVASCRRNCVSMNTALVTAFACTLKESIKNQPFSGEVTVTVNLRRFIKEYPGEAMGTFASAVRLRLPYDLNRNFFQNATIFHKKITKSLSEAKLFSSQITGMLNPVYLDALALGRFGRINDTRIIKTIRRKKLNAVSMGLTLSNLGRINPDDVPIEDAFGPVVFPDTSQMYVGIVTVRGHLNIAVTYDKRLVKQETMDVMAAKLIACLQQAAKEREN